MNYSAIIFNRPYPFPSFGDKPWVIDDIELYHKPFITLLIDPKDKFWKESLGSIWYERIEENSIILFMKGDPNISSKKTYNLYLAIALSLEIKCFNHDAIHLEGVITNNNILAPSSVSSLSIWKNSYWINEVEDLIELRNDSSKFVDKIKEMYEIIKFVNSPECAILYRESYR